MRCGLSWLLWGSNGSWMIYSRSDICRVNVVNIFDIVFIVFGSNFFVNDIYCECDEMGWCGCGCKMMWMWMESCFLVE